MTSACKIRSIIPNYAIPGAEVSVECENFFFETAADATACVNKRRCQIVAASQRRVLLKVPDDSGDGKAAVHLESGGAETKPAKLSVGRMLTDSMHIVANPAVDPNDNALILTRSGSRGQQLASTMYRLETDGYLDELPVEIMNPTGIAFDPNGQLYVTNRAEGRVYSIERAEEAVVFATGLGIATGIAFDGDGVMFVGDRSGTIYRIPEASMPTAFATLEPSVAAYHMAFGPDGRLFVTAPGLSSYDSVHAIDKGGNVTRYFRGLGRPQGLAFDRDGNLYVAACYRGMHGIVRIADGGGSAELFVAGNNVVGLCFTRNGEMVVATNDSVYSLNVGIFGMLL